MYSYSSTVRYSECDEDGILTIPALINYLQDCSTFQSQAKGIGIESLRQRHLAWLLAAWEIEVLRLPRFCDRITVSTWATSMARTQAHRNFTIADEASGLTLVRADSLWFTFDTQARRIVRVPEEEMAYLEGDAPLDMPPLERRLPAEGPFRGATPLEVGEQHLDTNHHMNNAQYVQVALSALRELGVEPTLRRICVQYRHMALLGDVMVPQVHEVGGAVTVDLVAPDGGTYAVVRFDDPEEQGVPGADGARGEEGR